VRGTGVRLLFAPDFALRRRAAKENRCRPPVLPSRTPSRKTHGPLALPARLDVDFRCRTQGEPLRPSRPPASRGDVFSNCEYACPILVNDMRKLEAALPKDVLAKVDFALVSFDTKRDTPEALASFRKKERLPVASWTLLRGENDDVRELAALLGINYVQDARGQFAHTNMITLLNAEGEIAFQQAGLGQGSAELAAEIVKLTAPKKP